MGDITYSAAAHWRGNFDERQFQGWVEELRSRVSFRPLSLGLVFIAPSLFDRAEQILEIIRVHGQVPVLAGCSSHSLIAMGEEIEENAGISVGLYALPGADVRGFHFTQSEVEEARGPGYWRLETDVEPDATGGWLAFIDPFTLDSESWLKGWNEAYATVPVFGGLASGDLARQRTQVYLNGDVYAEGGVAVSIGGEVRLVGVTSKGCTPIGETWTLTSVEQNVVHKIGNRAAYEVLAETFSQLNPAEQRKARGNLFIGLVVNEYLEDFHRGDFIIRNLLGADPQTGSIAIGALPRTGQTVQFQRRSAAAASEDLDILLTQKRQQLRDTPLYGGCLCACNGRGQGLFGKANHDADMVQQRLGPLGLSGFFCNGEIGPVGEKNFLHGYTASLALFVKA